MCYSSILSYLISPCGIQFFCFHHNNRSCMPELSISSLPDLLPMLCVSYAWYAWCCFLTLFASLSSPCQAKQGELPWECLLYLWCCSPCSSIQQCHSFIGNSGGPSGHGGGQSGSSGGRIDDNIGQIDRGQMDSNRGRFNSWRLWFCEGRVLIWF
jgi:hypothetical protein